MIQKIFRGKRGRILYWVTDALNSTQIHRIRNCNRAIDLYPMNRRISFMSSIRTRKIGSVLISGSVQMLVPGGVLCSHILQDYLLLNKKFQRSLV